MRVLLSTLFVFGLTSIVSSYSEAGQLNKPEKPEKVLVAHLADVVEVLDEETEEVISTTYYYNVIEVSERSLSGHSDHGDVIDGEELPDGSIWNEDDYSKGDKFEVEVEEEDEPEPS